MSEPSTAAERGGMAAAPPGAPSRDAEGLRRDDFRMLGRQGLGDPHNGVALSGSEFMGRVYVGFSRRNVELAAAWEPPHCAVLACREPREPYHRIGQLWCFDSARAPGERWTRLELETLAAHEGEGHALDISGQLVVAAHDGAPETLYVATASDGGEASAALLRSCDGQRFEVLELPELEELGLRGLGQMVQHRGRVLAIAPELRLGIDPGASRVYVTDAPGSAPWRPACEPGFGDPTNRAVSALASFGEHLYAGTLNPSTGYQLWRTRAEGDPPFEWERIVDRGAGRGPMNEMVASMSPFRDALYVGSGINDGGYDVLHHIGPAGAELVRVHSDGRLDLLIGNPRPTGDDRLEPVSGLGPGLESPFNALFWRLAEFEGCLYLGTFGWGSYLPYLDDGRWSRAFKKKMQTVGLERVVRGRGGFDLWRSRDGEVWTPVSLDGMGNPYNCGVSLLLPSRSGLVLGTANVFGPDLAMKVASGEWTYGFNPTCGAEIWLGAQSPRAPADEVDTSRPPPGAMTAPDYKEVLDRPMYEALIEDFYQGNAFRCWGLWTGDTENATQACNDLVDALLDIAPHPGGRVLEVGCGLGATTQRLLERHPPGRITACESSDRFEEDYRRNAPRTRFCVANPTEMPFDDESFGAVISIDRAGLFDTREAFLREARRVLKPGGLLLLSDRLDDPQATRQLRSINRENLLDGPHAYRLLLEQVGFEPLCLREIGYLAEDGYLGRLSTFASERLLAGAIEQDTYNNVMGFILSRLTTVKHYLLIGARRPGAPQDTNSGHGADA